jgi:hypothetical protein
MQIQGVDDKVLIVDSKQGVDHKVSSVIQGELYIHWPPNRSSAFSSVRCNGDRSSDSTGRQSSQRLKLFVNPLYHRRSRS